MNIEMSAFGLANFKLVKSNITLGSVSMSQFKATLANAVYQCQNQIYGDFKIPSRNKNICVPFEATIRANCGEVELRVEE